MSKAKIAVYTICKNESKNILNFLDNVKSADYICVLDTGSTDDTKEIFEHAAETDYKGKLIFAQKDYGTSFRFDLARNDCLKLVPQEADICVCPDLDERFSAGWRKAIMKVWGKNTSRARYKYVWNHDDRGGEGVSFDADKIHINDGTYKWVNPVHEILQRSCEESYVYIDGMQLDHWADINKSRAQYLKLLELAVKEEPDNDRNMHYLGREYMFHGKHREAIETLKRHLALPRAQWDLERCASMRFIGDCYTSLGNGTEAEKWYLRACAEGGHTREPWFCLERHYYSKQDWGGVIFAGEKAVSFAEKDGSYICMQEAWSGLPFDILSIGYYMTGRRAKAIETAHKALCADPDNMRIANNIKIMEGESYEQRRNG